MRCRQSIFNNLSSLFATLTLLAMPSGCAPTSSPSDASPINAPPLDLAGIFGEESDRRFDFGPVVGDSTRGLSHTFTLVNRAKERIKIVGVTNGMPCCGEVEPIPTRELAPGQSLEVKVTVRPSKVGPLRHWAAVTTDRPGLDDIILLTFAQVHAPLRIEAVDDKAPKVGVGQTFAARFDLIECYSKTEPTNSRPFEEPSISIPGRASRFSWEGRAHERPLSGGLMERVRPFSVTLTAGDQSGAEGAELVVADDSGLRLTHQLRWDVAGMFQVEPAILTIRSEEPTPRELVLRSSGESRFDVVDVRCSVAGLVATPRESDGFRHVIDVAIRPAEIVSGTHLGEIIVTTNLAAQRSVKIPIVLIGGKAKP